MFDIEELVGTEIVAAKYIDVGWALLTDDGVVIVVTEEGWSFTSGTNWQEAWDDILAG